MWLAQRGTYEALTAVSRSPLRTSHCCSASLASCIAENPHPMALPSAWGRVRGPLEPRVALWPPPRCHRRPPTLELQLFGADCGWGPFTCRHKPRELWNHQVGEEMLNITKFKYRNFRAAFDIQRKGQFKINLKCYFLP